MAFVWVDTLVDNDLASTGSHVQDLTSTLTLSDLRISQVTIMRTIVRLDIAYTVHDSGEGSQLIDIGIGVAGRDAFDAGVASLPNPDVETDFPTKGWLWRSRYRVFGFAADQPAVSVRAVDMDLRSRRKMDNGRAFVIIKNSPMEGVATTVTVVGLIRQLYLVG